MRDDGWVFIRNGEVRAIFKDREAAVRYFRKMLEQTLEDFKKQVRPCEYDYSIKIFEMEFKPIERRDPTFSLL